MAACSLLDPVPQAVSSRNFYAQYQRGCVCSMDELGHLPLLCATSPADRHIQNSDYILKQNLDFKVLFWCCLPFEKASSFKVRCQQSGYFWKKKKKKTNSKDLQW